MRWSFFLPCIPVAQGRPRAAVTRIGHIRMYDPERSRSWKHELAWASLPYKPKVPSEFPLRISLQFVLPKPASVRRSYPSVKPDLDNLIKGVLDSFTGIFWRDDAQIVDYAMMSKRYGAQSGVAVCIEEIEG